MADQKVKIIKRADIQARQIERTRDAAKSSVSEWIEERRVKAEAQRMRDLKAFFGDPRTV